MKMLLLRILIMIIIFYFYFRNRLSDYLFVLARYATKHDQREETIYMRPDPRSKPYKPLTKDLWKKSP